MSNAPNWKDNVAALPPSETALTERLQNAKIERARLAEAREAREASASLAAQVEAEEQALRDDMAIEAAVSEHGPLGGKIQAVHSKLGVVIVRKPNHVLFRRFQDSGKFDSVECEKLVRPCVVHPDRTAIDRYLEEQPALLVELANTVSALAGVKIGEAAGK